MKTNWKLVSWPLRRWKDWWLEREIMDNGHTYFFNWKWIKYQIKTVFFSKCLNNSIVVSIILNYIQLIITYAHLELISSFVTGIVLLDINSLSNCGLLLKHSSINRCACRHSIFNITSSLSAKTIKKKWLLISNQNWTQ